MNFIDLHICEVFISVSFIAVPAVGIGGIEVENHTSFAVYAYRFSIGVNNIFVGFAVKVSIVGVVFAAEVAVCNEQPCAFFVFVHFNSLFGIASVALSVDVEFYFFSGRSPYTELCRAVNDSCTKVIACVGVGIFKFRT